MNWSRPEPLADHHNLTAFDCGNGALNHWLSTRARDNEGLASRTFIVRDRDSRVAGYYALAAGSVIRTDVTRKLRHNLPDPVPVLVLGRLAVDRQSQGVGLARSLLQDALRRTLEVSVSAGVRLLIVHAIDDGAVSFYRNYGFAEFPAGTRTMFMPIETIADAIR